MAEERRNRTQAPPTRAGEQRGQVVGVYEVNRTSRARKVARVLLASGFVVTAYFAAGAAIPDVGADVVVAGVLGGDSPTGGSLATTDGGGPWDLPPANYQIVD